MSTLILANEKHKCSRCGYSIEISPFDSALYTFPLIYYKENLYCMTCYSKIESNQDLINEKFREIKDKCFPNSGFPNPVSESLRLGYKGRYVYFGLHSLYRLLKTGETGFDVRMVDEYPFMDIIIDELWKLNWLPFSYVEGIFFFLEKFEGFASSIAKEGQRMFEYDNGIWILNRENSPKVPFIEVVKQTLEI